jgi:hypothetical protein
MRSTVQLKPQRLVKSIMICSEVPGRLRMVSTPGSYVAWKRTLSVTRSFVDGLFGTLRSTSGR